MDFLIVNYVRLPKMEMKEKDISRGLVPFFAISADAPLHLASQQRDRIRKAVEAYYRSR